MISYIQAQFFYSEKNSTYVTCVKHILDCVVLEGEGNLKKPNFHFLTEYDFYNLCVWGCSTKGLLFMTSENLQNSHFISFLHTNSNTNC
jgi:hypothetical protein